MQDKNTKYDSMAMTHFKLPIKKKKKRLKKVKMRYTQLMNKYLLLFFLTLDSSIVAEY